jgi:molybdopterin synthase sulfur carrier subunit
MEVTVRYFALLREKMGRGSEVVSSPEGGLTVAGLRGLLADRSPDLADILLGRPLLAAVNREYAAAETPLRDGDEVALFPPVSGG